jgi:hypothetical protein
MGFVKKNSVHNYPLKIKKEKKGKSIWHERVIMRGLWSGWDIQIMAFSGYSMCPLFFVYCQGRT